MWSCALGTTLLAVFVLVVLVAVGVRSTPTAAAAGTSTGGSSTLRAPRPFEPLANPPQPWDARRPLRWLTAANAGVLTVAAGAFYLLRRSHGGRHRSG